MKLSEFDYKTFSVYIERESGMQASGEFISIFSSEKRNHCNPAVMPFKRYEPPAYCDGLSLWANELKCRNHSVFI